MDKIDIIQGAMKALEKNNMKAYSVDTRDKARELVMSLIKKEEIIGAGGSMTLDQCGIRDELRKKDYKFLDWFKPGISKEEKNGLRRETLLCDTLLTGSNAITQDGELYNVDGYGNRVAAMVFGPKKVIVVAGKNKIVKDLDEAKERLDTVAAPLNAKRLGRKTGCTETGYCIDCNSPDRICCHTVIQSWQMDNRIHVIIVNEDLGL